jgi:hypothetical protein
MVVVGLLIRKRDAEYIKPHICNCPRLFSCQPPSKPSYPSPDTITFTEHYTTINRQLFHLIIL